MLKILFRILSANALALVLKTVSGILFPRYMTTQDYAEYQTFSLYLSYLPILSLGFPTGMFIKYGGQSVHSLDKSRYKSEFLLLIGILLAFAALFFGVWLVWPERMLLYITLCIVPYCLVCSYQSLYQTWGEFGRYNRSLLAASAAPLMGSLVLLLAVKRLEAAWFIYLFIGTYGLLSALICFKTARATRGVRAKPVFDECNFETWKTGAAICVGSYIYVLIHSLDKQIVKFAFDTTAFAEYSFALSLQSLVTVFITALSQPMYHFLAKGRVPDSHYGVLMRLLLTFGAFGGAAYHLCRCVVAWLLPAYMGSLDIVAVYFLAFPPMAVIHCLFINLYKLRRQRRAYLIRLTAILILSVLMNIVLLCLHKEPISVAVATLLVNYIWFITDAKVFRQIGVSYKDGLFLLGHMALYALSSRIPMPIATGVVYLLMLCMLCIVFYSREVGFALRYFTSKEQKE